MKTLSRRQALQFGGTTLAIAGLTLGFPALAKVENPDAELLALEKEIIQWIDEINTGDFNEDEIDRRMDKISALETKIAESPAHSPAGVAVKFRRIRANDYDNSIWMESWVETSIFALDGMTVCAS